MKRFIGSVGLSLVVTFTLFFVMQMLVAADGDIKLDETGGLKFIDFAQNIQDQEVRVDEVKVEKPPEVETPPEIDIKIDVLDGPTGLDLSMNSNVDTSFASEGLNIGLSSDGDMIPLVRGEQRYPSRAAERGIGGWVLVEFSVSPDGSTYDAYIVEAEPKNTFNRSALNAVKRYKYKPRIIDGEAVSVTGVQIKLVYNPPPKR